MKIQLLIALCDSDYVEHLSQVLIEKKSDVFEVSVCSSPKRLPELLTGQRFDVALLDDAMAEARRTFDWDGQWACSIDPETAKAIRAGRSPEHEDSCSMCGKFCAVRSMNKALSGEHIDIL